VPEQMSSSPQEPRDYWKSHYDSMAHHESLELFDAEARDYFSKLELAVPLARYKRVLDFGCGLGFVSEILAGAVDSLFFWDYSENMLETAAARLAKSKNAKAVDLEQVGGEAGQSFDLILVNSVIQYMSDDEFSAWLIRWRKILDAGGALVISDVILPKPAFITEVSDSLLFAAKGGFLFRSLKKDFKQYFRYLKTRRQGSLMRYSKDEFSERAEKAGFDIKFLPGNLTYRSNRFSAVLAPESDVAVE